jgi:oligoendopeptidase F
VYREYPPFISEVASTTAEHVSQAYLIEHAATPEERLYHMEKYLDNFVLYVYGSCMMAEFEWLMYEMVEKGKSLQASVLNEMYASLLVKYYGPAVSIEKADTYAWMEYPHYYLDYYLYSYATSFSAAVQISSDLASENETAKEGFMDFLKTGNSEYPVESLKKAGVDMTSQLPYEAVTRRMNELLDEMEQLIVNMN